MALVAEIPSWCAQGSPVLDLGSGTGRHAMFLAEQGYLVDAIDRSAGAIDQLRATSAARGLAIGAWVANACAPDLELSRYRAVVCTFMLHYLAPHRALELLARARAHAAPGTLHAIAAFSAQGEIFDSSPAARFFFPQPGELAEHYRAARWQVHRHYEEPRTTLERRADGLPKHNLTSFVLASR